MKNLVKFTHVSSDVLNKEIKSIGQTGNKLNTRIQLAALNACYYSLEHGDIGYANRLFLAMNAGQRRNSLVVFMEMHGQLQWDTQTKQFLYKKWETKPDDVEAYLSEVVMQWHEAVKEQAIKSTFDWDAEAAKFIKRMEKAISDKNVTNKNSELHDYLAEAIAKYHADQVASEDDTVIEELSEEEVKNEIGRLMGGINQRLAA